MTVGNKGCHVDVGADVGAMHFAKHHALCKTPMHFAKHLWVAGLWVGSMVNPVQTAVASTC